MTGPLLLKTAEHLCCRIQRNQAGAELIPSFLVASIQSTEECCVGHWWRVQQSNTAVNSMNYTTTVQTYNAMCAHMCRAAWLVCANHSQLGLEPHPTEGNPCLVLKTCSKTIPLSGHRPYGGELLLIFITKVPSNYLCVYPHTKATLSPNLRSLLVVNSGDCRDSLLPKMLRISNRWGLIPKQVICTNSH